MSRSTIKISSENMSKIRDILDTKWSIFYKYFEASKDYYSSIDEREYNILNNLINETKYSEKLKILQKEHNNTKNILNKLYKYGSIGEFMINYVYPAGSDYSQIGITFTNINKTIETNGGRFYFALCTQWDNNLSEGEGWKINKCGKNNKEKFEYLAKNSRKFISYIEKQNSLKYNGITEIIANDAKNFIKLLYDLCDSYHCYEREYILWTYIYKYKLKYGRLPDCYTYDGKSGTILSPLYTAYYELTRTKPKPKPKPKSKSNPKSTQHKPTLKKKNNNKSITNNTNEESISNINNTIKSPVIKKNNKKQQIKPPIKRRSWANNSNTNNNTNSI